MSVRAAVTRLTRSTTLRWSSDQPDSLLSGSISGQRSCQARSSKPLPASGCRGGLRPTFATAIRRVTNEILIRIASSRKLRTEARVATTDQIKALIKSHVEHDDSRFMAVAMQVAAHAARQGHGKAAEEIRQAVDEAKANSSRRPTRPVPIATPRGELSGLLAVSYPKTKLLDMVLAEDVGQRLRRILREQRAQAKLRSHGLEPRRKLLLVGPPGSGKTMTASALAGELHLPLYVIVLDALITKFMGETAAKLRMVFDALQQHRGVYLFDEFDAIGGERAATNDVGEIRRVLNSFLQFLEQDESESIVVAATNHPQALDSALFRRFDEVVEYDVPPREQVRDLMANRLAPFDTDRVDWEKALDAAQGLSHAEVARACESAAKEAVLDDHVSIRTVDLVRALSDRRRAKRP